MSISGSNNRFRDVCRSARGGRQASNTKKPAFGTWKKLTFQFSAFNSVKKNTCIYSRLTKGIRGTASAPYHFPSTQRPPHLPMYLRAQRVFHLVLLARFSSHLLACCTAPAALAEAEGLLEFRGLLITASGQQDWNLQLRT